MLEVRRRRCQLATATETSTSTSTASQMNAAPFVFCGILFVTRFYHFTCGAALRLTEAHCTRMYVCARGYICMFVWHSQNQIITFAYASAEAAVAWWASATMMMTTTMTIAEQREWQWQWQWKREQERECVFLGWWRWRRGVNNDESNPHMQRESGREREYARADVWHLL